MEIRFKRTGKIIDSKAAELFIHLGLAEAVTKQVVDKVEKTTVAEKDFPPKIESFSEKKKRAVKHNATKKRGRKPVKK